MSQKWFRANKLSLNSKKTKYLLFHSSKKQIPDLLPNISIDMNRIEREKVTKFLGVLIDENLSWKQQIDSVWKKVSKGIGILYGARNFLNKKLLKQLYFAFIHSHINYCNIAWASTYKTNLETLKRRQKHALRVISHKDKFFHSRPLFIEMNILDIYAINILQVLCLLYKCHENKAPSAFNRIYAVKTSDKYTTRSTSKMLIQPFSRRKYEMFSFAIRGPRLCNE